MLNTRVYTNAMYMMLHRKMEDADKIIKELEKREPSEFISEKSFHNMGCDFKSSIKTDLKDIEERILMSFCLSDKYLMQKQYVFFGNNSKSFLEYFTTVIMNSDDTDYENFYTIVIQKDFTSKLKSKLLIMASKANIHVFLDDELLKPPFHAYGCSYELMTDEELSKLMSEICITKKEMKKISSKDPIIKYYGYPSGKAVRLIQAPMISGSLVKRMLDYRYIE